MSDFFEQPNLNNVVTKDKEVVQDFSRIDPRVTLGDFSRQNEGYSQKTNFLNNTRLDASQNSEQFKEYSAFSERQFKKREDKKALIQNARIKIFVSVFMIVTLILTGFVIYNAVALALLNKDVSTNKQTIDEYSSKLKLKGTKNAFDEATESAEANVKINLEFPNIF